ncbi:hypothetical protein KC19_10G112800 [Ceratodon purpureus]|uniref:LIM zinc-binding domain-containing protein n=1 Tax=Ceratodon purpureus TaxID=3225 RepID=A0A8T0GKM0_CERPU|nr:hypothetical protein KC19_10G112800 [Ceratodon purpureus]
MAWFDRIFGDPGSSSSYRYNEGDEYPAYSDVPRRTYGGWNGSNIFQDPRRGRTYSPERPSYRSYDMPSYDYDERPSYCNTNDWPTYGRERASSPYDPSISEATDQAIALALSEEDEYRRGYKYPSTEDADEELARAMQENLDLYRAPRITPGMTSPIFRPPVLGSLSSAVGACAGCKQAIGYGRYLNCMGKLWHPDCFLCKTCDKPITDREFSVTAGEPHHRHCFKDLFHPKCAVCQQQIPPNANGQIEYRSNPFWKQSYCPRHERDGTHRCCSCERLETRDSQYATLEDGRKLCLECLETAVVDTKEGQPLYREILKFYKNCGMMIDQEVPMLLVAHSALNEARLSERGAVHTSETRGLCLSEEQIIPSMFGGKPRLPTGSFPMWSEPQKLVRHCEVTAILVLYGLPRLLTGSILAHELMHAWLRLAGEFPVMNPVVEEGICQVMSHIWTSAEVKRMKNRAAAGGKGSPTPEHIRFGEFILHNIATDTSPIYGDGFRRGIASVSQYGLTRVLEHLRMTGTFP